MRRRDRRFDAAKTINAHLMPPGTLAKKELIKNKYTRLIMPEHPRSMENDKGQKNGGYTGWVYNVGYARAMMQAALLDLRKS